MANATAFIKFDGIDGQSEEKDHKAWSDLDSFSWGGNRPGGGRTGAARTRGAVDFEDVTFVMELDKSTPKLQEAFSKGKVFSTVKIDETATYTDEGQTIYLAIELKNVSITHLSMSGSGAVSGPPVVNGSLNYEEIKIKYTEFSKEGAKKGNVEYTWKVEQGES
ncbi:MAG: type VI secretion system tube protein Hcp [Planctomycetaceae bacterium]|nr:type VI secretion system tube protein Hcp [Planctomycetaceae bacterium]